MSEPDPGQRGRALTRRRFLARRGRGRRRRCGGRDRPRQTRPRGGGEPEIPQVALGSQPAGLPARSTPGRRRWPATAKATRSRRGFDRLLFFDVDGTPDARAARGCSRPSLRTLERTLPMGARRAACSRPAGVRRISSARCGCRRRSRRPRGCRTSSCPRSTTTTCASISRATTSGGWPTVEAALLHGAPLPGADGPLDALGVLRWRETRTGFVGAGLPAANQNVGGIPPGSTRSRRARRCSWGSSPACAATRRPRTTVTIPSGPFARRHDDAGQLHAPAARQLVRGPLRARAGRAHVRAAGDARAGQAASRPTPRAIRTCSTRRSAATESSDTPRRPPAPAATASR